MCKTPAFQKKKLVYEKKMGRNSPARVKTPRCTRTGLLRFFLIDALINPRATRIEKMQFSVSGGARAQKTFHLAIVFVSKFIFFFFFLGGG